MLALTCLQLCVCSHQALKLFGAEGWPIRSDRTDFIAGIVLSCLALPGQQSGWSNVLHRSHWPWHGLHGAATHTMSITCGLGCSCSVSEQQKFSSTWGNLETVKKQRVFFGSAPTLRPLPRSQSPKHHRMLKRALVCMQASFLTQTGIAESTLI